MARSYTTAARRAAATPAPTHDPTGLLAWVDNNTLKARQALRELEEQPVDRADPAAVAARQQLVDALLDIFPSFDIDGVRFHAFGEMQLLDLCELMKLGRANVKTVDPAGVAALADFFAGVLGPSEYDRFRVYCRENVVEQDLLNDIMEGLVEDLTEVPTSRPSRSAPGPSSAGPGSKVVSLSARTVHSTPVPMSTGQFADFLARQARDQRVPLLEPPDRPRPAPPVADPVTLQETTPGYVSYG